MTNRIHHRRHEQVHPELESKKTQETHQRSQKLPLHPSEKTNNLLVPSACSESNRVRNTGHCTALRRTQKLPLRPSEKMNSVDLSCLLCNRVRKLEKVQSIEPGSLKLKAWSGANLEAWSLSLKLEAWSSEATAGSCGGGKTARISRQPVKNKRTYWLLVLESVAPTQQQKQITN